MANSKISIQDTIHSRLVQIATNTKAQQVFQVSATDVATAMNISGDRILNISSFAKINTRYYPVTIDSNQNITVTKFEAGNGSEGAPIYVLVFFLNN